MDTELIPTEFSTFVQFNTVEAIKAVNSLKILSNDKEHPIVLTIGESEDSYFTTGVFRISTSPVPVIRR